MREYDALDWPKGNEDVKTYYVHYVEGLEATAARRLELLRRITKMMEDNPGWYAHDIYEEFITELAEELADDDD